MRQFDSSQLPRPRNFEKFVLPQGAVDLEIGCGTGLFAINYAHNHPDRTLIAIEHTREKFRKFTEELRQQPKLLNLVAVHANAISWVSYQLAPNSIEKIFLLYPNPNPKLKHLNKRWHAMPFMKKLIEVLKPEGEITLVTNELFYVSEAKDFWGRIWKLREKENFSFDRSHAQALKPRTLFEKKYLERGETCHQLVVVKPGEPRDDHSSSDKRL